VTLRRSRCNNIHCLLVIIVRLESVNYVSMFIHFELLIPSVYSISPSELVDSMLSPCTNLQVSNKLSSQIFKVYEV
jgi:hypothetical protein